MVTGRKQAAATASETATPLARFDHTSSSQKAVTTESAGTAGRM